MHGAKGLQAPIVILPDTATAPRSSPPILWLDGVPLWPPLRVHEPPICVSARAEANRRRDQEYRRLLYVAMTRAEDRLLVCGWHGQQEPADTSWYGLIRDGVEPLPNRSISAAVATGTAWVFACRPSKQSRRRQPLSLAPPPESEAAGLDGSAAASGTDPPAAAGAVAPVRRPARPVADDDRRRRPFQTRASDTPAVADIAELPEGRRREAAIAILSRPVQRFDG